MIRRRASVRPSGARHGFCLCTYSCTAYQNDKTGECSTRGRSRDYLSPRIERRRPPAKAGGKHGSAEADPPEAEPGSLAVRTRLRRPNGTATVSERRAIVASSEKTDCNCSPQIGLLTHVLREICLCSAARRGSLSTQHRSPFWTPRFGYAPEIVTVVCATRRARSVIRRDFVCENVPNPHNDRERGYEKHSRPKGQMCYTYRLGRWYAEFSNQWKPMMAGSTAYGKSGNAQRRRKR